MTKREIVVYGGTLIVVVVFGWFWLGAYWTERRECPRGAVVRDALTAWPMCADGARP